MKKYNCPYCKKELIRLEPYEDGIYEFWCDTCNVDITIENNKEKRRVITHE
jgi:transposase-like protein